jgi:hypothetical protein
VIAQVKKKKTIFKRNERINEEHDKYLKNQDREQKKKQQNREKNMKEERTIDVKKMSKMNQYEEFHDFENDEKKEEQMMKYFDEKSVAINKKIKESTSKESTSKEKALTKMKIMKKQIKKLVIFKKIKISDFIKVMKNKKRFDIQKMMNLIMNLLMSQLLNESQQLRKKFA